MNGYSKILKQRKTVNFRICNQKVLSSILGVVTIKSIVVIQTRSDSYPI